MLVIVMFVNVFIVELFMQDSFKQEFIKRLLSNEDDFAEDLNPLPDIAYKYSNELFKIVNDIESPLTIVNQTLTCFIDTYGNLESTVIKNKFG